VLAAILLVAVLAVLQLHSNGTSKETGITVANYRAVARVDHRPAPAFRMSALSGGETISLSGFAGRIVVLNFWASWCAPCRREAPDLQRTWQRYRSRGIQFLGVDYRDDRAAAMAFDREFGITYPSVYDPAGILAFDFDLFGVPTTFLIDRTGQIVYEFRGYLNARVLRSAIDDVLRTGPS
jgi:cytochrome c biogenesis protein CcmG, thiol:disulfide interchange protein DsbE